MKNLGDIKRVTIEFSNKTISLEGDEARKWKAWADRASVMLNIHGHSGPTLNWRETAAKESEP